MTQQELRAASTATPPGDAQKLAGVVLVRIATHGGPESEIARDLEAFASGRQTPEIWRIELSRLVAALAAGGLVERQDKTLTATARGLAAAAELLGSRKGLPVSWERARDEALIAKALGIEGAGASRRKLLAKADGLAALIVVRHWGLKIKGAPSASRVRSALAVKALERAFGNQIRNGLGDKSALPAKAGRLLASQLSNSQRDFGTDARLVAALAAEACGVRKSDLKSLRLAVLRAFVGRAEDDEAKGRGRPTRRRRKGTARTGPAMAPLSPAAHEPAVADVATATAAAGQTTAASLTEAPGSATHVTDVAGLAARPGPEGFARAVLAATAETAEGWAGNRKAFICKVWDVIQARHPHWALSEIEFKCMLTEAHRTGLLALANADLKDKRTLKELQLSAVIYKNTVWHFVRAQD